LSSSWWCSSWSVSVGTFFLDLFCGGIVSCFSAETRWAPMFGGPKNRIESPNTRTQEQWNQTCNSRKNMRQKISKRLLSPQKLWIPLHVPSRPFYRETKGLLHTENTLEYKEYS
jgi:hypothetical protein